MYTFNTGAIFSPGHPYIESTTVLSDSKVFDQIPVLIDSHQIRPKAEYFLT